MTNFQTEKHISDWIIMLLHAHEELNKLLEPRSVTINFLLDDLVKNAFSGLHC